MNKKFFLLSVLLSFIGAFILFKIVFLTGFDHSIREFVDIIKADKNSALKYRIAMSTVVMIFLSLNSYICFKLAKKKGKDPWKWARKGFLYSVYAIAYLLFFSDSKNDE